MAKKPIALIIMDGYGINQNTEGNAIVAAKKPHLEHSYDNHHIQLLQRSLLTVVLQDEKVRKVEVTTTVRTYELTTKCSFKVSYLKRKRT